MADRVKIASQVTRTVNSQQLGDPALELRHERLRNKDAVAFVVHAPGAPMEEFSRAAAALAADGNTSMEAVLAIAERYGIELLGPMHAAA
jgi:hypothetical protein